MSNLRPKEYAGDGALVLRPDNARWNDSRGGDLATRRFAVCYLKGGE